MIKIKRYLTVFIIALAMVGITARAYCYNAEVVNISGNKYFPAVKEALVKAKASIYLVMFTIELSAEKQNSKANQLINTIIMESGGSPVLYKEIFDTTEEWNKQNSDLAQLLLSSFEKGDLGAVHLYYILLNLKFAMSGIQAMLTIEMQHGDHHKGYKLILKFIDKYINLWDNPQDGERQFIKMSRNGDVRKTIPQLIEHIKSFHTLLKGLQGIVIKIQKFEEEKSGNN